MNVPMINLLPWRQLRQIRQNAQFRRAFLLVAVGALVLVSMIYAYQKYRLDHQQAINDGIRQRMAVLDDDIARIATFENEQQELINKANSINNLRSNRMMMVQFFEQLADLSDGLVYFTHINHAGETLTMTGVSKNSTTVSQFAQRLGADMSDTPMMSDVLVTSLQQSSEGPWVSFVMTARLNLMSDAHKIKNHDTDNHAATLGEDLSSGAMNMENNP